LNGQVTLIAIYDAAFWRALKDAGFSFRADSVK
jgi:hypothetical protein